MVRRTALGIRRRPVLAFFVLALAITWGSWLPLAAAPYGTGSVRFPLLYILGGLGPGIAGVVVMRVLHGSAGDTVLTGALLRWRVGLAWWLVAVLSFVVIWAVAAGVGGDAGRGQRAYESGPLLSLTVVRYLLAAVPEEVGWRGFALPMLQARHGALVSSLVVGAGWALWHLPLLITADNVMSTYPWCPGSAMCSLPRCCTGGSTATPGAAC